MISLFGSRGRQNKQFSFVPRYYSEDKEIMQERYRRIEAELKGKSTFETFGSGSLKEKWKRNKRTSSFEKKSNVRLVFITCLLLAICYWMFYY